MKVSLIIPVYNASDFLRRCLESALSQTWTDYEVIVVDDGSVDESVQICEQYCLRSARIHLIKKEHEGPMCTWIRGVKEASGDYIAFLDADDWVEPDYLERMLSASEGADMVCCSCIREYRNYQVLQEENIRPGKYDRAAMEKDIFPVLVNDGRYLERGITPHRCAKMIRKKLVEGNLCWCDKKIAFGEDFNIIFPVIQDCQNIVILDDKRGLYHYRQNDNSILRGYKSQMFRQIRRLYIRLLKINKAKGGFDFSCQIWNDSFCLFLEYVKNEARRKVNNKITAERIVKNYKRLKRDFQKRIYPPLHLSMSDKMLVFFLERGSSYGVYVWLSLYVCAKYLTGGTDWKYRSLHRKKRAIRVVMSGPDMTVQGGIRTVAAQYVSWKRWEHISFRYIPVYIEKNALYQMIFFWRGCFKIWLLCLFKKVDIVHLHMAERGSFYRKAIIMAGAKKFGVKVVLHHHGAEFFDFFDQAQGWKKKWIRRTLEGADLNLVLGRYQKGQMRKRFPGAACRVFYNTIRCPRENMYQKDARGILFAGRMGQRKGIYDLLKAVSECDDELGLSVKLYLCGDGEISGVHRMIRKLGLEKRVLYMGWLSPDQMEDVYRKTMIFVLPSYREGMPMSLLEAMAHGIPCIAGRAGAVAELLEDGKRGILVKPGDVSGIAQSLLYLYKNPAIREKLGASGFQRVREKFRLENGVKELQKIWTEMM